VDRRRKDVPEQEEQDACRDRAQECFQLEPRAPKAPNGQPEEDGEARDCTERENLSGRQSRASFQSV
jgi:hypothetical protein